MSSKEYNFTRNNETETGWIKDYRRGKKESISGIVNEGLEKKERLNDAHIQSFNTINETQDEHYKRSKVESHMKEPQNKREVPMKHRTENQKNSNSFFEEKNHNFISDEPDNVVQAGLATYAVLKKYSKPTPIFENSETEQEDNLPTCSKFHHDSEINVGEGVYVDSMVNEKKSKENIYFKSKPYDKDNYKPQISLEMSRPHLAADEISCCSIICNKNMHLSKPKSLYSNWIFTFFEIILWTLINVTIQLIENSPGCQSIDIQLRLWIGFSAVILITQIVQIYFEKKTSKKKVLWNFLINATIVLVIHPQPLSCTLKDKNRYIWIIVRTVVLCVVCMGVCIAWIFKRRQT